MMKVILVNGSPHENGCTYTVLSEIADTFAKEDIQPDIFWIGNKPLYSCVDCGKCEEKGCCVFEDRGIDLFYGAAFFVDLHSGKNRFYLKPAAAVVSARRAGTTDALDQINKYFLWGHMPELLTIWMTIR